MRRSSVTLLFAAACARTAPVPAAGYWVASDSSQYTPVARFRIRVAIEPDRAVITFDEGVLAIPGETIINPPVLMSDLYLTALIAVPDSSAVAVVETTGRQRFPERRGWAPIASSDSVLLVRELHYGERAVIASRQFAIPGNFPAASRTLSLVFRITGNTVELMAPLTAGASVRRRDLPGGVHVFACGDRDLIGRADPERARLLKEAYGVAC